MEEYIREFNVCILVNNLTLLQQKYSINMYIL